MPARSRERNCAMILNQWRNSAQICAPLRCLHFMDTHFF